MRTITVRSLALTGLALAGGSLLRAQDVSTAPPPPLPGVAGMQLGPQVALGAAFGFVAGKLVGGKTVTGQPYSAQAVTNTTQTLADGNTIASTSASMIYRDSQGRERREMPLPNIGPLSAQGGAVQTIMISDPVAGVNYMLNPGAKTAVKMPAPPPLPSGSGIGGNVTFRAIGPPGGMAAGSGPVMIYKKANGADAAGLPTPNMEQLGTLTIAGVETVGTRTTFTIPAGQIGNAQPIQTVSERWYSPDLQVTVRSKHTDPRMGETDYNLTNINRNEPDASLFQVPADYTVKDGAAVQFSKPVQE